MLAAQSAAIEKARAGKQWQDVHDVAIRVAAEGMIELGILGHGLEEDWSRKGTSIFMCTTQAIGWDWMFMMWGSTRSMAIPGNWNREWS